MFSSQQNPAIAQVRRELRGKLPDRWLDEVLDIIECGGETLDELTIEDLLKLQVAATYSSRLRHSLNVASRQQAQPQPEMSIVEQPRQGLFSRWF